MTNFLPRKAAAIAALVTFSLAVAQAPLPAGADTLHFSTRVGSFKIVGGAPTVPPSGRLEMTFTGTLLVVGLDGQIQVTGNLRKEYENAKYKRVAYHGTGKVVIDGKITDCQWFGRDMDGTFKGQGIVRLYGEFDQKLETGKFWYASDPNAKYDWRTNGLSVTVPKPRAAEEVIPKVRTSD